MLYQPSSRPQTSQAENKPPSLDSTQPSGQALEEEQDSRLKFPVGPQATESCHSSSAGRQSQELASHRLPEQALEEELESSYKSVVQQTTQLKLSSSASHKVMSFASACLRAQRILAPSTNYEVPLLTCSLPPRQALDEEKESVHVGLMRPSKSSDNVQQLRALQNRGELFSSVPEECVRPRRIEGQRSRAVRNARGHGKISSFLLLMMLIFMGVAQALTDCQILNDWLPKKFNEASCCEHLAITCVSGRITQMYVA
jgi:hypothetical protein